jgi:hypothetical protein
MEKRRRKKEYMPPNSSNTRDLSEESVMKWHDEMGFDITTVGMRLLGVTKEPNLDCEGRKSNEGGMR